VNILYKYKKQQLKFVSIHLKYKYLSFEKLFVVVWCNYIFPLLICLIKFFAVAFILLLIIYNNKTFALTSDEQQTSIREQERIEQRLERERQDKINQQEIFETDKIRKTRKFDKEKEVDKTKIKDSKHCILIKQIDLNGNTIYSEKKLRKRFLSKHENQCISKIIIDDIKNNLENFYISKGYTLARVYFNFTKLNENILDVVIYEGIVDEIKIQTPTSEKSENSFQKLLGSIKNFRNKTKVFTAFPFKKNKVYNLRDFEQGIDQMNRLASNNVILDTRPDEDNKEGYSDIIVKNKPKNTTSVKLGYDNSGSESTGKRKKKATLSQDNLLALNDNIYISYTKDNEDHSSEKFSKSLYSSISIPLGYWTTKASYSKSEYLTTINGVARNFKSSGDTITQNYGIDKVIIRRQKFKNSLGFDLDVKETNSYIEDVKSETGSRKLSIGELYSNNTLYTKAGTFFLKPSYERGLDWFNAKSDDRDSSQMNNTTPRAQFEIFKLYGYWNTNFNLPKTQIPLNYMFAFNTQNSQDTLFGSEQFSVGGQYSVRGFSESSISGDNGYNIRNDLKINTLHLLPQNWTKSNLMLFGSKKSLSISNALSRTYLSVFYDYGYARNHKVLNGYEDKGYMSGTGVSLNYNGNYFDWDITYAKGLHSPQYLRTRDNISEDRESVYFNVSVGF